MNQLDWSSINNRAESNPLDWSLDDPLFDVFSSRWSTVFHEDGDTKYWCSLGFKDHIAFAAITNNGIVSYVVIQDGDHKDPLLVVHESTITPELLCDLKATLQRVIESVE